MGSGERKRCSNMAPVRRLRNLAWIKARRLPGVRCSTLKTEWRSLLCRMIIPGRSWVAGIDIAGQISLDDGSLSRAAGGQATFSAGHRHQTLYFRRIEADLGNVRRSRPEIKRFVRQPSGRQLQSSKWSPEYHGRGR